MSGVLPDYHLADFMPEMQQVVRWAVLIARANNLTRRSGWGLPEVWEQIKVGDYTAAAAALTREYGEFDDWPHARVAGIEFEFIVVRCPFCSRLHRHDPAYGHAESPCGRRDSYIIVDPMFVLPFDPAGGRRSAPAPTVGEIATSCVPADTRPRRFR